jgi:hypothetical protein
MKFMSDLRFMIVRATLDDEALDNIKMFYLRIKGNLSHDMHASFRQLFVHGMTLDSVYMLHQRMLKLSHVVEDCYDCCKK